MHRESLRKPLGLGAILLLPLLVMALGCGDDTTQPEPSVPILTTVILQDSVVVAGDSIVARVSARNEGTKTATFKWRCSLFLWALIEDSNGDCVSGCIRACWSLPDSFVVTLAPGDSISETYRDWSFNDHMGNSIPPGVYFVVGGLAGMRSQYPWARAPLRIVAPRYADRSNRPLQPTAPHGGG